MCCVLLCTGTVEAVSLRDIYRKATGRMALPRPLYLQDPIWEKQRKNNQSSLIHIYRFNTHSHRTVTHTHTHTQVVK